MHRIARGTLHAHLCAAERHSALEFRRDCPVCRLERGLGVPSREALLPPALSAGVCAGVLGASAFATPALAQDDDPAGLVAPPGDEGAANGETVEEAGGDERYGAALELSPGIQESEALVDPAPPSFAPAPDEDASLPGPSPPGRLAPADRKPAQREATAPPAVQPPAADAPAAPVAPVAGPPAPIAAEPPATPVHPTQPAGAEHRSPARRAEERSRSPKRHAERKRPAAHRSAAAPSAAPTARPALPRPAAASSGHVAATSSVSAAAPPETGSSHLVKPGESLWSVAQAKLGRGASAAEIARYVQQIWDLNAERIGTGDPDLIRAGQRLLLP